MEYNGWKNKATWNVALWLNNDEWLYQAMCAFAQEACLRRGLKAVTYRGFIRDMGLEGQRTPDGFKYNGRKLDYGALTDVVRECIGK